MKKFVVPFFLFSILFTGCASNQLPSQMQEQASLSQQATIPQTTPTTVTTATPTTTSDQLFQKNQECSTYKDKIEQKLAAWFHLEEIFYSPIKEDCIYIAGQTSSSDNSRSVFTSMDGYFTNENIGTWVNNAKTQGEIETEINQKISELKWE